MASWFERARDGLISVSRAVAGAARDVPNPCVVTHTIASTWQLPAAFALGDYAGLLSCQVVVTEASAGFVLTHWNSRTQFDTCRDVFEKTLGLTTPIAGTQREGRFPKKSRFLVVYSAIATLVIVFGTFKSLAEYVWMFCAWPHIEVTAPMHHDVVVDEDNKIDFKVSNLHGHAPCSVALKLSVEPKGLLGVPVSLVPLIPRLGSGDDKELPFLVKGLRSGECVVNLECTATAGWIAPTSCKPHAVEVFVWPRLARSPLVIEGKIEPKQAVFVSEVISGVEHPHGLDGELMIVGEHLALRRLLSPILDRYEEPAPMVNTDTRVVKCRFGGVGARIRRQVKIEIESTKPLDEAQWHALLKSRQITFEVKRRTS